MAVDASKLFRTPAQMLFGTAGAEIDLGGTEGGISVNVTGAVADILTDQTGNVVLAGVDQGDTVEIATKLMQHSVDAIMAAFPDAVKNAANTVYWLKTPVGADALAQARSLLLKRVVDGNPTADKSGWFRGFKARRSGSASFSYANDANYGFQVTFRLFSELRTALGQSGYYVGVFGDETAV